MMDHFNPSVLIIIVTYMSFLSVVGLPLSLLLLERRDDKGKDQRVIKSFYLAPVLGFGLTNIAVFYLSIVTRSGTDSATPPVFLALLLCSIVLLFLKFKAELTALRSRISTFLIMILLFILAAWNIVLPVVTGKWYMAYSTGNDGARYLMMINYLRETYWEFGKVLNQTLAYPLINRPLQHISGAAVASIFSLKSGLAYSISGALASIMAALSFCFLFESLFPVNTSFKRVLLWVLSVVIFGLSGIMTNIYYTGYLAQHFSIYTVIASLGFFAVEDNYYKRGLWFLYWNLILALSYSVTLSFNYVMSVFTVLLILKLAKQISLSSFVRNFCLSLVSAIIAVFASVAEGKGILYSITRHTNIDYMSVSRDTNFAWPFIDTAMRWAGIISRYEKSDVVKPDVLITLLVILSVICLVAILRSLNTKKGEKQYVYSGLMLYYIVSVSWLILAKKFYLVNKGSIYWPFIFFLGYIAFSFDMLDSKKKPARIGGLLLISLLMFYVIYSARLMPFYWNLAQDRYTKLDDVTDSMRATMSKYNNVHGTMPEILGLDYAPERHLLLREFFREYRWQPVSDSTIWGEFNLLRDHPKDYDDYNYNFLLYAPYAKAYECECVDLSGNNSSLIFDHPPFKLFSERSSYVEMIDGFEFNKGDWDEDKTCYHLFMLASKNKARLRFINNGGHEWLKLSFRYGGKDINTLKNNLSLAVDDKPIIMNPTDVTANEHGTDFTIKLNHLSGFKKVVISASKSKPDDVVNITRILWGY